MNKGLLLAVALGGAAVAKEAIAAPVRLQGERTTSEKANIGWEKPADNTPGVIRSGIDRTRTKLELAVTPGTTAKATFACPDPKMFLGWKAIANNAAETAIACDAGKCDIEISTPNFNGDTQTVSVKCVKGAKGADSKYNGESDPLTAIVRTETPGNYAAPVVVIEPAAAPATAPLATLFDKKPIIARGGVTINEAGAGPDVGLGIAPWQNETERTRATIGARYTQSYLGDSARVTDPSSGISKDLPTVMETTCVGAGAGLSYDAISGETTRVTVDLGLSAEYCDTSGQGEGRELRDLGIVIPSAGGFAVVPEAGISIGGQRVQIRAGLRRALAFPRDPRKETFVPSVTAQLTL